MGHTDLFSLFYALIFRLCAKQCIFFFCPALPLTILCSRGSSSGGDAQLRSQMAGRPIKAEVVSGHLGEKILELVSDVELLR